jgi:Ser/Thr protein kinase RdoA (MazF antagonist)
MNSVPEPAAVPDFERLTPDLMLELTESALGLRTAGVCRPLASYINRVAEVVMRDGPPVIAKFYRPGRWSEAALRDEQAFLLELHEAEVPVIPPLEGADGRTLHEGGGLFYAVFPKRGGRLCDDPSESQWLQIGRLVGRMHEVGARHAPNDRITLHPAASSLGHLDYLLRSGTVPASLRARYESEVRALLEEVTPLFGKMPAFRIHGDCHRGNILQRPEEPLSLIDFDDMATGPAVQDLWMLLPDSPRAARRELDLLLEGYTLFRPFPSGSLRLIEPLRAMRFLHYTAWCARQKADGGFARIAPDWGSEAFWRKELADWARQKAEIADALDAGDD